MSFRRKIKRIGRRSYKKLFRRNKSYRARSVGTRNYKGIRYKMERRFGRARRSRRSSGKILGLKPIYLIIIAAAIYFFRDKLKAILGIN